MGFFKKIGLDPFVICLFMAIVFAWLNPQIGISNIAGVTLEDVATWGVSGIFFFYGLKLDMQKLKAGLVNIKLHLLIHFSTFVIFPLIVLGVMKCFNADSSTGDTYLIWLGVFFLATLPSTVSSSVVMVSIARGNIPAAIFNASISSILGIFLTPILMSIVLGDIEGMHAVGDVVFKLIFQVVLPIFLGLALNGKYGWFANNHKVALRVFDQSIIVLIVYTSFCESFFKKMFDGFSWSYIAILSVGVIALLFCLMLIISIICKFFGFNKADKITAVFCGSKKSLVHGSVLSKVLFDNPAMIGVILLPTMLYHAYQLIIISVIAKRLGRD